MPESDTKTCSSTSRTTRFDRRSDILPNFVHKPPNFAPGEATRYCNVAYVLLGLMVERATGMTYRDYVAKHVFAPAGMNDATFASSDIVTPRIAEGADPVRDESGELLHWHRNVFSYPPVGAPDGGAHVTVNDVVAFHRALVERAAPVARPDGPDAEAARGLPRQGNGDAPHGVRI